jgi:hypothetical protein
MKEASGAVMFWKKQRLVREGKKIISRIDAELQLPEEKRDGHLPDNELNAAKKRVSTILGEISKNELPEKSLRHKSFTRIIIDQWPFKVKLGDAILDFEAKYCRL